MGKGSSREAAPRAPRRVLILEDQVPLLLHTNMPLTIFLSFSILICSCLILRSMTVGDWSRARAVLMILLFLVGMAGVIFVVHEI